MTLNFEKVVFVMTEFEKKVMEFLEWRRYQLSRSSRSEIVLYILLAGAVLSLILGELVPLFQA